VLEQKLKAELRRLGIGAEASVVVAVSGGADSVSLLDALVRLKQRGKLHARILVAHLNHQLRGEESDADEIFVERLAVRHNLECVIERIAVAEMAITEKRNLEAIARQFRYDFLAEVAEKFGAEYVCTAHTQDDQAETVLMRLLRGSGAEGLKGIHSVRPLGLKVKLIRPLLTITRAEVLDHCQKYGVEFCNDSSNFTVALTRNRVRHELLPLLKSFNPRSVQSLSRTATLLTDDDDCLQKLSAKVLAEISEGAKIKIKPLLKEHPAIRRRVLRQWLRGERGGLQRIEAVHIAALERLILCGQGGQIIELPGGWHVRRKSGVLEIMRSSEKSPEEVVLIFEKNGTV